MRILIFEVNWRGDVLFSTPAIRAIRKKYPDSFITALVVPRCREILEQNPNIDEIVIYNEHRGHRSLLGKLSLIRQLRRRQFDLAFIFHRSFTRALMIYLAGIPGRIGYNIKRRGFLLTQKVELPRGKIHKVEYFLNMVRKAGIKTETRFYEFYISQEDKNWASRALDEKGINNKDFLVILNPGGNWKPKRWLVDRFAELADKLVKVYDAKIVITGASKDEHLAEAIANLAKAGLVSFCGKTDLKRLGALLEKANLIISGDSGPLHIGVALGVKAIALFGPTSPDTTGPYGKGEYSIIWKDVGCEVPCYNLSCNDYRCMKAITAEDVMRAIQAR
ncbi:MAG: lipopolysaccharide heptosyltransferase II [Candidatus Omnitrophota bacterium]|nr:lipopolysaccharide heptosyltransferase II [Candidatus Omnitrophota bacterium]